MSNNNSKSQIRLPIIVALAVVGGMLIGANMSNNTSSGRGLAKSMTKFREIVNYIERNYVDEVETDKLVEDAISTMLENLDPHSVYIPAEDLVYSAAELEGNFEGIGIEYSIFRDTIHVVTPLSGGPSEEVGLLAGDKIIKVNGELVAGIGIKNRGVLDRLRGPKGSEVTVSILRRKKKDLIDFTIERDKIPQFSVDASYMVDETIGYIKVNRFTATTDQEFHQALTQLNEQGMQRLLLDLTGNPGGYMDKAIKMADEFLPGDPMIVFTKGKESRYNQEHRANNKGLFEDRPLIVMIDEGSASASEIVSGAVQDHDRGLIVGRRSFGKGLVQMPMELSDGSELRLTISRYYTPSGRSIQKDYSHGTGDYYSDIINRYSSGEIYDSGRIEMKDSLAYLTTNGRTVYGGGGIIPDHIVPLDTIGSSDYLNKLFTSNTIREFALKYVEENGETLKLKPFKEFHEKFQVNAKMLESLIALAKSNKVAYNHMDFVHSRALIKTYVKAQIARSIWDNNGFYPIWNETNEIYREALTLFDQSEEMINSK